MSKQILLAAISVTLVLVLLLGWMAYDFIIYSAIQPLPARPDESINTRIDLVLRDLEEGNDPDFDIITSTLSYIDARYDCSDFRLQSLTRILFDHAEAVPQIYLEQIRETVTNFKYWMDQSGHDSMCFWSENHQIMFSASEYLLGYYYQDEIFPNENILGKMHMEMGKDRVLTWLEQRWLYGFAEFYSNTYYMGNIAPLANLIDFAPDEEVRKKAEIVLDLLLYDLATQSYQGTFTSVSGRMYANGKKHPTRQNMRTVSEFLWDYDVGSPRYGMELNFIYNNRYEMPEVIRAIGYDDNPTGAIKASNGLDLTELRELGLVGQDDNQIMMQWAMEAFSNPEVVTNSIRYINNHNMFSNEFLNGFRRFNITLLGELNLMPLLSRALNPQTNGVAIQRGNTYTYKTEDYLMATAQSHHPGEFADQQHVFHTTLHPLVTVFHQHPASALGEGALSGSPGYWVGYGRFPHSVQKGSVNLTIYVLPERKGFMEEKLYDFTHAYFPTHLFDSYDIEENHAFGRIGQTYVALIARNDLRLGQDSKDPANTSTYDLIQEGRQVFWVTEVSSKKEDGSYEEFVKRIRDNAVQFDARSLTLYYHSNDELTLTYKGDFKVNGEAMDLQYPRMDSPYAFVEREPETIEIRFDGHRLHLDFYNMERTM